MSPLIGALDHVVIAVRDLSSAATTYAKLFGRRPSWRGAHPEWGTANVLFRLDNMYVELLAATSDGLLSDVVRTQLAERGEGLMALAFATGDADAFCAALRRSGVEAGDPIAGHGADEVSAAVRHWRNVVIPAEATRGPLLFAIQHDSAEDSLPIAAHCGEAEAVIGGLDHVVIFSDDADASRAVYGDLLGLRLALDRTFDERGLRLLFFRVGGLTVEVGARLERKSSAAAGEAEGDQLWGLAYRSVDVAAARKRLLGDGFDVTEIRPGHKKGTRVCTVREETHGVATLIIEAQTVA